MVSEAPRELAEQVASYRRGDDGAAEWLARRALTLALRTAAAIARDSAEARDIAQDVTVDVLVSLPALRDPELFDAWVHRITVRRTLLALRRRRARERSETALESSAVAALTSDRPDVEFVLSARAVLAARLAELPPRQQLALALRYVHDCSDAEIAAALGCRIGSVHALLSRGRAALRRDRAVRALADPAAGG